MDAVLEREVVLPSRRLAPTSGAAVGFAAAAIALPPGAVVPAPRPLRGQLVIMDSRGHKRRALPVVFDQMAQDDRHTHLIAVDTRGGFRIALKADLTEGSISLDYSFRPPEHADPSFISPVIKWLEELKPARSLGVWDTQRRVWFVPPEPIAHTPNISRGYAEVVHALDRIGRRTGAHFVVPAELDDDLATEIEIADRLTQDRVVVGTWSTAETNDDREMREFLGSAAHGVQFTFLSDYELSMPDGPRLLGTVRYTLDQALLSPEDPGTGSIRLVAGDRNRLSMQLVAVRDWTSADGSTAWVPSAMLEPYEGRWIAQSGTTVLSDGDAREEVVSAIRARGVLATVWRVPPAPE